MISKLALNGRLNSLFKNEEGFGRKGTVPRQRRCKTTWNVWAAARLTWGLEKRLYRKARRQRDPAGGEARRGPAGSSSPSPSASAEKLHPPLSLSLSLSLSDFPLNLPVLKELPDEAPSPSTAVSGEAPRDRFCCRFNGSIGPTSLAKVPISSEQPHGFLSRKQVILALPIAQPDK